MGFNGIYPLVMWEYLGLMVMNSGLMVNQWWLLMANSELMVETLW